MKPLIHILLLLLTAPTFAQTGPRISFQTEAINCGEIPEGPAKIFVFPYTNTGDSALTVQVKSSCGCLAPRYPHEPTMPGETDTIWGTYATDIRPGMFSKTLSVSTNDKLRPKITLHLSGKVTPYNGKLLFKSYPQLDTLKKDEQARYNVPRQSGKTSVLQVTNNDSMEIVLQAEPYGMVNYKEFPVYFGKTSEVPKNDKEIIKNLGNLYFKDIALKPGEMCYLFMHLETGEPDNFRFKINANGLSLWFNFNRQTKF